MNDTDLGIARESSRHLATLLRHEQGAMADFLVALADFDRRALWRELGHSCLFYYLQRELRLSDGAAHFRKVAARLIQRFPEVVEPLREGKLCITSIVELARVMTPENRAETLPQFFHMSKRQAKTVAAAILPAAVPRREVVTVVRLTELRPDETPQRRLEPEARTAPPMRVEPLTANESRIHLTVSNQFLEKLEAARRGQGHVQPGATKEQVIEAALDLLLEKQASRRAEVKRPQMNPRPAKPGHVTAAVKRAVWARDGGKCQWPWTGAACADPRRGWRSTTWFRGAAAALRPWRTVGWLAGFTTSTPPARFTETPTWTSSPVEYQPPRSRWQSGVRAASPSSSALSPPGTASELRRPAPQGSYRGPSRSRRSSAPSAPGEGLEDQVPGEFQPATQGIYPAIMPQSLVFFGSRPIPPFRRHIFRNRASRTAYGVQDPDAERRAP